MLNGCSMRKKSPFVLVLLFLTAACRDPFAPSLESPGRPPGAVDLGPDPLRSLRDDLAGSMRMRRRADVHAIALLDGRSRPLAATPDDASRALRRLLEDHAVPFGRSSALELRTAAASIDALGILHVRMTTHFGGHRVFAGEVRGHFSPTGELRRLRSNGWIAAPENVVSLDPEAARVQAALFARQLRPDVLGASFSTLAPEIFVLPLSAIESRLAYRISVVVEDLAEPMRLTIFVDATSGEILRSFDDARRIAVVAQGSSGPRSIEVASRNNRLYLEDSTIPTTLKTYTAKNRATLPGTLASADTVAGFDPDAVDLHANLRRAYDYFADVHGLDRWLGGTLRATLRYGVGFNNAFFDGNHLAFGDGDGIVYAPLGRDPDVVAHELSHSVVQALADLVPVDDSGAIDEAFADVFAALAAVRAGDEGPWKIGEHAHFCGGQPCAIRDLQSPSPKRQAVHLADKLITHLDNGGVHFNSTIASHAAYLMAAGNHTLSVPKLGAAATEQIWFRALKYYVPSDSDFPALAESTMAAADDLGYSTEAVRAAWSVVGVEIEAETL